MTTASAPGKVILCGEHAVVYGRPAIALPLSAVRATATVTAAPRGSGIVCEAPDIAEHWTLMDAPQQPLAQLVALTLQRLNLTAAPDLKITLRSEIPIASGMGSGAALGAALVKAISAQFGHALFPAEVSALVYESERLFHGTPSGIDNTVVSFEQPIWYQRVNDAAPIIEPVALGALFMLVIGDTGVRAPTYVTVGAVRRCRQRDRQHVEALFEMIAALVQAVRNHLAAGDGQALGLALNQNQQVLRELGVSAPVLERLIDAARTAGALGAKLSGGGGGGVMLALVEVEQAAAVEQALRAAGAVRVLQTTVG